MSGSASRWMKAALAAMVLSAPGVAGAQGVSGDYLAARSAAMAGDFAAAAEYFDRTILFDKDRVEFLERAALAHMSLGNIERAAILGERILVQGESSQIAQMAMVAQSAQNENYSAILAAIADDKGPGPLTDGLVRAWSLMGQGDMTSAINAFDAVGEMQGMQPFAIYHKALALASVGDFEGAEALMGSDMGGCAIHPPRDHGPRPGVEPA